MPTLSHDRRLLQIASIAIVVVTLQIAKGVVVVTDFFPFGGPFAGVIIAMGFVAAAQVWNDVALRSGLGYLVVTGTVLAFAYYPDQLLDLVYGDLVGALGFPLDRVNHLFANMVGIFCIGWVMIARRKAKQRAAAQRAQDAE